MTKKTATASLILVGNELLDGRVQDVHVKYLSDLLSSKGIAVNAAMLIPDDSRITQTIQSLSASSDLVIIAGGLGPTSDDLTRESVAAAADVGLVEVREVVEDLERRFRGNMAESNRKQALIPDGFTLLHNPRGTAPGFYGEIGDAVLVALPGPPRELRAMVDIHFEALLSQRFVVTEPKRLKVSTYLVSESRVEDLLREAAVGSVSWGTRAEEYRILVELRGGNGHELRETAQGFIQSLGPICAVEGDYLPHNLFLEDLLHRKSTFAAAESCTGGLIGKMLTDLPGSSAAIWGSLTTYANSAKVRVLSVPQEILDQHGAVSSETVTWMCKGAKHMAHTDFAVAVSGIAGPEGGTEEKPVGTVWIGCLHASGLHTRRFSFTGGRDLVRRRAAVAAILMARSVLHGIDVDKNQAWAYI